MAAGNFGEDFGAAHFPFDKCMLGEGTLQTHKARITITCFYSRFSFHSQNSPLSE